jgi:dTDP-4-dehydrorhamnose reductase
MSVIAILGGTGLLGSKFVRQLRYNTSHEIHAPTRTELDLTSSNAIRLWLYAVSPRIIINCAAWTDVVGAEDPDNAKMVNALNITLPAILANYAHNVNARLIHFSTDYVFDGTLDRPYTEFDLPNPINVYGRSKYDGERAIMANEHSNYVIIRTSSLYATTRQESPSFVDKVIDHAGGEMTIYTGVRMTPTPVESLVDIVIHRVMTSIISGVIHLTPEGSATWLEFAQYINWKLGLGITFNATAVPYDKVPRPAQSVLRSVKTHNVFLSWQLASSHMIEARKREVFNRV